ncbi:MAG: hypothetical protein ACKO7W_13175, partial [Elainella sp.]
KMKELGGHQQFGRYTTNKLKPFVTNFGLPESSFSTGCRIIDDNFLISTEVLSRQMQSFSSMAAI